MEGENKFDSYEEGCDSSADPEMANVFKESFYLEREEAITLKKNYILHMSAISSGSETRVGVGLSSYEACVYSVGTSLQCTCKLPSESSPVINVKFAPDNPSMMYVGCNKGVIKLWDLRDTTKPAQQFQDTTNPKARNLHDKNFCSFDVNNSGRFLCAGTEVTDGDAYLLFWDTRQTKLLGGYWECHTDDVTQVSFNPSEADQLVTGSTDGLINLYDISQSDENDALLQSYNTESSVEKLKWHDDGPTPTLSCVTHTTDIQLWRLEDSGPYNHFTRSTMENALVIDNLYGADVHSTSQIEQFMVLAGSNLNNGRCLRSALAWSDILSPHSNFEGNKQIIRCSWFDIQNQVLLTGGEGGILSQWKIATGEVDTSPDQLKATRNFRDKPHKTRPKPY